MKPRISCTLLTEPLPAAEAADRAAQIEQSLLHYADPAKALHLSRFFKTGPGQYGQGDRFLGLAVPTVRSLAAHYTDQPLCVWQELLRSPWHECRLCALVVLTTQFVRTDEEGRRAIYRFYLSQTAHINNWDLVDTSAPTIVGTYLRDKPRTDLYRLAASPLLWDQRIAMVSTLGLIRNGDLADTLALAERLLHHPHDLMHKATGWMLREVGKRDKALLVRFLERHARTMPRTMLRYAIEKFSPGERQEFMRR